MAGLWSRTGTDDHLPGVDEVDVAILHDVHAGRASVRDPYPIDEGAAHER